MFLHTLLLQCRRDINYRHFSPVIVHPRPRGNLWSRHLHYQLLRILYPHETDLRHMNSQVAYQPVRDEPPQAFEGVLCGKGRKGDYGGDVDVFEVSRRKVMTAIWARFSPQQI